MRKPKKPSNSQGFINTYNAGQHSGAYGTPEYQANYDPTQGFGTPQPVQPRTPDWQEQLATSQANRNVGLANQQYLYTTGAINRDFGYDANGNIDPNNPYSRAALLEQSYKNSQRGNTNSFASQGQLYAGSLQNAQNEAARQHSIGVNQLQNQYNDANAQARFTQLGAYANAGGTISDESFQALLRALGKA